MLYFQGKLGKHTVGMAYRQGYLEVTPEVRSVPLGAKRKRGRPKKVGHCMARSPLPPPSRPGTEDADETLMLLPRVHSVAEVEPDHVPPIRVTTRKRKKPEPDQADLDVEPDQAELDAVEQSPVAALLGQVHTLQAGLGASKPPKKMRKLKGADTSHQRPPAVACKKAKNTCKHEVVFGQHYNKALWTEYADHVKSKRSSVAIDPTYMWPDS